MSAKKKAPASRSDEIVAEIVNLLTSKQDRPDKFATEFSVRGVIQLLKAPEMMNKPLWGFNKSNDDALCALQTNIGDLQNTFKGLPNKVLVMLAMEKLPEPDQIPSSLEQENALERLKKIVAMLGYVQRRCDQLLERKPGQHGNADFSQRLVAEEAWQLMKNHKLKPASGLASSDYGEIACLLFEAATGKYGKDLQRACKSTLKRAKEGELNTWKGRPTISKGRLPM
jgi:hypothetical protein